MKKHLLSLLALLTLGISGAWASGYTATLSSSYELVGYKMKAFYNFQTNTPEVLPTSGDLRYRANANDGKGSFGLHNYGSGSRSATVSIPVSKGDILVVQTYNTTCLTSITNGTKNESLSTSTGYNVFDMTADAESETWTVAKSGGCVCAVVMEKDASAETADYTIKYQDADGNTLKDDVTYSGGVVVGATYTASSTDMANFYNADKTKKYIYVSGNESKTAAATNNVITLVFKEAAKYSYTVKNNLSDNILYSGSVFEGDNVTVTYPFYINVDGTLYSKAAQNSEYHETFSVTENNLQHILTYTATDITNVVFLAEGEDIFTVGTGSNAAIRCSMEKGGYATEKTTFANISAGQYQLVCSNRCKGELSDVHKFYAGENLILSANGNGYNAVRSSEEFIVTTATDIALLGGSDVNLVDWVYIQKTADVTSATLSCAAGKLGTFIAPFDVTLPENVKAYSATSTTTEVNLTKIAEGGETLAACTPVIIYNEGDADASATFYGVSTTTEDTKTVGALTGLYSAQTVPVNSYVLQTQSGTQAFYKLGTAAKGVANRCYVTAGVGEAKLAIAFDDAMTAVAGVKAANAAKAQPVKAIKNGRLVIETANGTFNAAGARIK